MKKKFLLILCVFIASACIGGIAYLSQEIDTLENAISVRKQSVAAIDEYIRNKPEELFENSQAVLSFNTQAQRKQHSEKYVYAAPEGFYVKSNSEQWNEDKLKLLYDELKLNKHGTEIQYLSEVIIYPEKDEDALATHHDETQILFFDIGFPALKSIRLTFERGVGVISLYGGDVNTTVESMAISLSHEYGHHYTIYHMFEDEHNIASSEYARIRNITQHKVYEYNERQDYNDYLENHEWYWIEMAADDYVLLMGSPTTRQVCDIKDIQQLISGQKQTDSYNCMNAFPHENLAIPLASEVDGLKEYFYSFIDEEPPVPEYEKQKIEITIKKGSKGYNLVGGHRSFVYYELKWNKPYEDAVYTVVCYDKKDYDLVPIKTVYSDDTAVAYVGTVTRASSTRVRWTYDNIDEGTKVFLITALLPDGTIYLSEPLEYKFSN